MPTALQTPLREGQAEKVGKRLYRKQLLPVGSVKHEGHELKFTPDYLKRLAANFNAGKMDQVPFVLVGDDNSHSQDPERVRGEVTGMEVHDDGLYALAHLSERGEQLVKDNPKLGVSARINQDDMVIEHMAGTVNPVAKGMKAWEALDLSQPEQGVTLFDLTEKTFEKASDAADSPSSMSKDALTPEERDALKALAARIGDKDVSGDGDLTDDDIQKLLNPEQQNEEEPEPVALSKEAQDKIDLAQSDAKKAREESTRTADKLAESEWKNTERDFLEKGVPPSLLKLAKPHLSTASSVIELSKSDSQASAMLKMLEEAKGTVDLAERSSAAAEDRESEESEAKELAKDEVWEKV
jgi:hypothetical protein